MGEGPQNRVPRCRPTSELTNRRRRGDARRCVNRPPGCRHRALPRSRRAPEPDGAPDLERRPAHDRHRAERQGRADDRRPAPAGSTSATARWCCSGSARRCAGARSSRSTLEISRSCPRARLDEDGRARKPIRKAPTFCSASRSARIPIRARCAHCRCGSRRSTTPRRMRPCSSRLKRHSQAGDRLLGRVVARIVRRRSAAAGLADDFSGHSMLAGFVTTAAANGVYALEISNQTRHKSHCLSEDRWRTSGPEPMLV